MPRLARLCYVAVLCAIVALACSASGASAASFPWYWHGSGSENCWQTGQLGATSQSCDYIGAGFLEVPGRLHTGGIGQNVELTPSGDYCSYELGGGKLTKQDANDESGKTGFGTPTPYGSYQEWDGSGDVCQANSQGFGQELNYANCGVKTCNMAHYVSLREHQYNDQPWSTVFGSPSFTLSTEADIQTLTGSSPQGWGFVCPIFQDMNAPHNILEYCFQEWRGSGDAKPEWEDERIGSCAEGPSSNNIDTVQTFFYKGTQFATMASGSAETGPASSGWKKYSAIITEANLKNAIELDRKSFLEKAGSGSGEATPELGYGCGRAHELSTEPSSFALIGIEQGAEGWGFTRLGAGAYNLQAASEYTPRPPEATTGGATNIREEQATLTGTVNPRGTDTHYYFQYGDTTSYGLATSEVDAGSGLSGAGVNSTISELQPGETYHYRLVATNGAGQSAYGADQTVTTASKPAEAFDSAGTLWTLAQGPSNSLALTVKQGSNGSWSGPYQVEAPGTTYSEPAVAFDSAGTLWVLAEGPNHSLSLTVKQGSNGSWSGPYEIDGPGTTYSAPSIRFDSAGTLWVLAQGPNHSLSLTVKQGSNGSWSGPYQVEEANTTYSAPTMAFDSAGSLWVLAEGPSKSLYLTVKQGSNGSWSGPYRVEEPGTTYSTPAVAFDSAGVLWTLADGPSQSLYLTVKQGASGGGTWSGPYRVEEPGTTFSEPSMLFDSAGELWTLAEGPSQSLYLTVKQGASGGGAWSGPYQIDGSGTTYSAAAEAFDSAGTLWALAIGANNTLALTVKQGTTGAWSGPYQIDGTSTNFSKAAPPKIVKHAPLKEMPVTAVATQSRKLNRGPTLTIRRGSMSPRIIHGAGRSPLPRSAAPKVRAR